MLHNPSQLLIYFRLIPTDYLAVQYIHPDVTRMLTPPIDQSAGQIGDCFVQADDKLSVVIS